MNRIHTVAATLPDYLQPTFSPPSTRTQLDAFAEAIGAPLPSDVRDFFAVHDAISAPDIHNGYFIGDTSVLSRSIQRGDFPVVNGAAIVFAIGSDGGGNAFVTLSGANGPVWNWRHDIGDFLLLSDTFLGFLARVADDFEAYSRGDDEWQFM
ncbi:SMI1/KNR4 family protein [Rhodopirellula sp. SWK7]|uniref:SMI1/KNR4 family protein n=1 Tax=Rhodopirellula sp. SWK7 TaxID=595460 RepID=UPI000348E369|nr:SMI1/KNR4 family protein [Rhodopirellula sp. SWK7]